MARFLPSDDLTFGIPGVRVSVRRGSVNGWVYFLQCSATKRVKIGYTANAPQSRINAIQAGSATRLYTLRIFKGSMLLEKVLHQHFDSIRLHNEWFKWTPELERVVLYMEQLPPNSTDLAMQMAISDAVNNPPTPEAE